MAGPYSEEEVRGLVRKGLRDALVKPEGGDWIHVTKSPFAGLVAPTPKKAGPLLWCAAVASVLLVMWLFVGCGRVVVIW